MDFPHLFARLDDRAREQPDEPALVRGRVDGTSQAIGFGALHQACAHTATALRDAGVRRGGRAVVMTRDPFELTAVVYALWRLGAVPVLVDPGLPGAALRQCLDEAAPEFFVGEPLAHLARKTLGWARAHVRTPLVTGPGRWGGLGLGRRLPIGGTGSPCPPARFEAPDDADLAMIAFTSGSTGVPKGVEYRYGTLAAQAGALTGVLGLGPGVVLLCAFLPFTLFGPVTGATTVVPAVSHRRPAGTPGGRIVLPLTRNAASVVLGSPAVLGVIAGHCARHGVSLPSVERVCSFGAPLHDRLAADLARVLRPDARVLSVYGATECLPVSTLDASELRELRASPGHAHEGTCVGRPVPGVRVRILPVPGCGPDDGVGEIAVSGPNVSPSYHRRPDADAAAKESGADGMWHRTGDMGSLDEHGRVWFRGRRTQRVTGTGFDLTTENVEAVLDAVPGVRRTALVGVGPAGRQRAVLCAELNGRLGRSGRRALTAALREALDLLPNGRHIGQVLLHPGFPTDVRHNSKIDRERLASWAAKRAESEGVGA